MNRFKNLLYKVIYHLFITTPFNHFKYVNWLREVFAFRVYSRKLYRGTRICIYMLERLNKVPYHRRVMVYAPIIELSKKIDFICNIKLDFLGFWQVNRSLLIDRLIQLWESPYLEFLCCNCFKT